jgi:hypothetical protein
LSLCSLLLVGTAWAHGFQVKTMRAPLSAIEVERPLIVPMGWLELGLEFEYKVAGGPQLFGLLPDGGAWSADGEPVAWDSARWTYTTETLAIRYGVSRRAELWATVPFHYVRLTNEVLGTDTSDFGVGDARFGWRLEWLRQEAPLSSVATDVYWKAPLGKEAPGSYIGGSNTVTGFPMSTGTNDIAFFLRGKQQLGPLALTASVGFIGRLSGVSQFVVETSEYQFQGRFKPGDEVRADIEPLVQVGPIALQGHLVYRVRYQASAGTTAPGIDWNANLRPFEGSDGQSLDAGGGVLVNATRGVDARAGISVPVMGEDLTFFPLEELTPTRGVTYSAGLELRY